MCLVIYSHEKELTGPFVAEENIICYKRLSKGNTSTAREYKYRRFKKQPLIDLVLMPRGVYKEEIEEGYHSCIKEGDYHINPNSIFVIPKGATYYKGHNNYSNNIDNYVSNTIIFVGRNNSWTKTIINLFYKK